VVVLGVFQDLVFSGAGVAEGYGSLVVGPVVYSVAQVVYGELLGGAVVMADIGESAQVVVGVGGGWVGAAMAEGLGGDIAGVGLVGVGKIGDLARGGAVGISPVYPAELVIFGNGIAVKGGGMCGYYDHRKNSLLSQLNYRIKGF